MYDWITYDDSTGNKISITELSIALEKIKVLLGKNIDILGLDESLMQRLEYCYELKEKVDYIIGSERYVFTNGWPYDEIIKIISLNPNMNSLEYATKIADVYNNYYSNLNQSSTISVVKTSLIDKICQKINRLCAELTSKINNDDFRTINFKKIYAYLQGCKW